MTTTIRDALVAIAAADGGVTTLLGAGAAQLYPGRAPPSATDPYATMRILGGAQEPLMGADSGVQETDVRFSVWSASYATAATVLRAIQAAYRRYRGTILGVVIQDAFITAETDLFDEGVVGADRPGRHEMQTELTVWHIGG